MPEEMTWDAIPEALLIDCAQLVKANSIEGGRPSFKPARRFSSRILGNKKDNLTIIYTPGDNLKVLNEAFLYTGTVLQILVLENR